MGLFKTVGLVTCLGAAGFLPSALNNNPSARAAQLETKVTSSESSASANLQPDSNMNHNACSISYARQSFPDYPMFKGMENVYGDVRNATYTLPKSLKFMFWLNNDKGARGNKMVDWGDEASLNLTMPDFENNGVELKCKHVFKNNSKNPIMHFVNDLKNAYLCHYLSHLIDSESAPIEDYLLVLYGNRDNNGDFQVNFITTPQCLDAIGPPLVYEQRKGSNGKIIVVNDRRIGVLDLSKPREIITKSYIFTRSFSDYLSQNRDKIQKPKE
jgi:hypothetical protein